MKKVFPFLVSFSLVSTCLLAQQVSVVKDINNSLNNFGSNPNQINALGTLVVFTANDPLTGTELWVSNGTSGGTSQLKDIWTGGSASYPSNLTKCGAVIYFTANDGINGYELWKTDGTANGTVLVKDINAGVDGSSPSNFTEFNGLVYFSAYDPVNGTELWKTDGTEGGTSLVADIASGSTGSNPYELTAIGTSYLIFSAYTPDIGQEIHIYNGAAITSADIYSGTSGSYPDQLTLLGTNVLFRAYNPTYGYELFTTDGTTGNTKILADIVSGAGSSYPFYLTAVGSTLFFRANDVTYGYEVWRYNGSTTTRVTDVNPDGGHSYPSNFTASGSGLFFVAHDGSSYALRHTTGSGHTTISGTTGMSFGEMISYGSSLVFFNGYTAANGYELWRATSTTATLVSDIAAGTGSSYPYSMVYTGSLLFAANDNVNGHELWLSDGSTNTIMVKDINVATDSNIEIATNTPTGFLMSAFDGVNGQELWKTDVTSVGTEMVADINPGADYSYPYYLGKTDSYYYCYAYHASYGYELWKTDGVSGASVIDIIPGTGSSYPNNGVGVADVFYFTAYDPTYGYELWKTDGTTTSLVKDIYPGANSSSPSNLTLVGSTIFFRANNGTDGSELWKTDGTETGTVQVRNINSAGHSSPFFLTDVGGVLYFRANDGVNGNELWKSDGTFAGTVAVKDINPTGSSNPNNFAVYNGSLFFSATDGTNGFELWKSDGTLTGTLMVKDIEPGAGSSSPAFLTPSGNNLYFRAYTSTNGYEIWRSSGGSEDTDLLKDIAAGTGSSFPNNLSDINGTLYFSTSDATGNVLYKTNGTTTGTRKATSAGEGYDSPWKSYYYDGKILFRAKTNYGNEPLSLMAEPIFQPTALNFTEKTSTSVSGSFTAAAGSPAAPSGYIILRKSGVASTDMPLDGTPYSVGETLGTSVVAAIGSGTSFTDNFTASLIPDAHYYAIFSYNYDGVANIYRPYSPLQGSITPLAAEPATQATSFTVSDISTSSYTVSFTGAGDSPAGYLILKKAGTTAPDALPVDGTEYTLGVSIGTSTVAYIGSGLSFSETGLIAGETYSYAVFSYNGTTGTYNYLTASALTGSAATLVAEPTAQPTSLVFSGVTSTGLSGTFTDASPVPYGYIVLRSTTTPVDAPVDGTSYTAGATVGTSVVVNSSMSTTFSESSLTAETLYYYAVYAFNGSGSSVNYLTSSPLTANKSTLALEPEAQPTGFAYSNATASSYTVTFAAASGTPENYLVLRMPETTAPADLPVDGTTYHAGSMIGSSTVVQVGSTTTVDETGLSAETTYSYAIFAVNGNTDTYNYLTGSPLTGTASTLAIEPASQPAGLGFSSVQASSITLGWTAASGAPSGYLVVRKTGSAPAGTPADGIAYAAGDVLGDGIVAYSGSSNTFDDTGLSSATDYFYRVFSYNGSDATANYLISAPLTGNQMTLDLEPVTQPTTLQFSNVGITTLSASFSASASGPVSGYIVIRNESAAPTGTPVDGTTYIAGSSLTTGTGTVAYIGSNTAFSETDLMGNTLYHYAVYAYNDVSGPINYLTASPLRNNVTTLASDDTPPVVTNTTPSTVASGLPAKITATITDAETGVSSVSLQYRSISGNKSYTTVEMSSTGSNNWESPSILAAEIGDIGLEFMITATNGQNLKNSPSSFNTLVSFADQNLPYDAFGIEVANYRIISVPLNLNDKTVSSVFGDNLGNYDNTKYRIFHFSNDANTELKGSSSIEVGKGYWFIAKTQTTINTGPGTAANVKADAPYSINLASGWNQIGNPYPFNISWADVLAASGNIDLKLRTFNGNFKDGSTLSKFEGGFVFANAQTTIVFPTTKNASVNGRTATGNEPLKNPIHMPEWDVSFKLVNGGFVNELSGLGMRPAAETGYDRFDDFTLPRLFEYLELNHGKSFLKTAYSKDVVPTAENNIWEFTVDSNLQGITQIEWDNSYFGNNDKAMVLMDVENQTTVDMQQRNTYSFNANGSRKFKVVYGNRSFIQEHTSPDALIINTVFPNPSSSDVTIGFTTPDYTGEAKAQVRFHTVLGQPVKQLFDGSLASGYHEMTWNVADASGERVSAGIYLIEIKIGNQVRIGKLIIE
jgi:ELWxxDGT repeat protein